MFHYHKCLVCNCEWRHTRDESVGEEIYKENHTCTGCGRDIRFIHRYENKHNVIPEYKLDLELLYRELNEKNISVENGYFISLRIAKKIKKEMKMSLSDAMDFVIGVLLNASSN